MTDVFTKKKRSEIMSKIKGKWTKPERLIHNYLKAKRIRHRMHPNLPGKPDIVLTDSKTVIFIDGCFWHGCPKCKDKVPSSHAKFWKEKIKRNKARDKEVNGLLRKRGFKVVRIWEHDINKRFASVMKRITV